MIRKEYVIEILGVMSTHADIYKIEDNIVMNIVKVDGENEEILSQSNTWFGEPILTEEELAEL